MKPIITLKHISKKFTEGRHQTPVLDDISLEIHEGEFFIFVGPSGSGKSTVLRVMSHLEKDYKGEVVFAEGITPLDMSFVFQQFALLPWLTVHQNIELGLIARKVPEHKRAALVGRELTEFGLEKFAHHFPRELSGGMRQRVGIARALVTSPKIVFLDEPFSELDVFTAEGLRADLLKVWQERKMTVVMVSHIVDEALELADRIAVVTPRPARIERIIHNTLPRPRQKRSPEFFALEDEIISLIRSSGF
jgi:NitT/TauT family transport system ATP-binding protein